MLCQSKVVSKVLSRGHGMSESPETKKVWTQVERWGEGMFLLDVKRSWKHWAVWRNVVYSVCSEKWGGGIVSRKMGHGDCTGDLSESRWLIKVSFSQGWRRKWWACGPLDMQEARHWRKEARLAPGFPESVLCQDFLLRKPQTMALNTTEYLSAALISHLSSWTYLTE